MTFGKHDWVEDGVSIHNGEYWYRCKKCKATDWIASYGTRDQLRNDECLESKPADVDTETKPDTSTQELKQEVTTLQDFDVKLKEMLASLSALGCTIRDIKIDWLHKLNGTCSVLQTNYDVEMLKGTQNDN